MTDEHKKSEQTRFIDLIRDEVQAIHITKDADGNECRVGVIYGKEPWQDVFSRVIRGHYLD